MPERAGYIACAGSGFATGNLSANSILLGGTTPCKPETATGTNIICSSSPWITPGRHSTFAGGRGIHLNRWLLSDSSSAGLSGFLSGGKQPERPADLSTELESLYLPAENVTGRKPYMEQLQSIFTPTATGVQPGAAVGGSLERWSAACRLGRLHSLSCAVASFLLQDANAR